MKFKHGTRRRALEYEKDWVGRWKDDNTFEKSVENRSADNAYVFYDGPPFITGVPHHGTLLSSIVKDAVPRYWTMKGKRVERRWGWDCHGLPAENYVEKQLGITDRRQIVTDKSQPAPLDKDGNELPTISLETYINKARESMVASSETWEGVIDRIGRWVDFKGAYRTMDKDFMESVWWAFKKLYDGGKIYEGEKVLMYDTKFATPVSKAEVTMDNDAYQTVTDPSVYVKFRLNALACADRVKDFEIDNKSGYIMCDLTDYIHGFEFSKEIDGLQLKNGEFHLSLLEVTDDYGLDEESHAKLALISKEAGANIKTRPRLTGEFLRLVDEARERETIIALMEWDGLEEWRNKVREILPNANFVIPHTTLYVGENGPIGYSSKTQDLAQKLDYETEKILRDVISRERKSASILAWTTTPWTLPANLMLAVNPEMVYCEVLVGDEKLIIAKDALERVLKDEKNQPLEYEVLREFPGSELVGKSYEPLETGSTWPENDKIHKIYAADFVSNESGSGIVHIAPAYGEDDFELAKGYGIAPFHVIDDNGYYTDTNYKGLEVWDNNKFIAKDLKEKGIVWKIEYIRHEYPFNPRSKQRIMYRAIPSWFFDIQGSKPLMLEQNENINWFPEHLKHGRFAKNIEQAPDWNLSRDRFWATAMPVWKGDKGTVKVVGSYAELKELSGVELEDYHRPWVDDVTFTIDGEKFTRIDKVLDCWFESGSMPFAQLHYPFENQEKFEQNYPAEFITEYVPQVRAWFYYVHSINTNLAELGAFGEDSNKIHKNAFKNVIVTGTLAGNDGRKMSKSFGNFTDPNVLMDKFSADSLRFLLLSSPLLNSEDFALHDKDVGDVARKLGMVWNMYDFFTMYAEVDGWEYDGNLVDPIDSLKNPLDIWIVSRVHQLVAEVETYMDEYNIPDALSLVLPFLDDASNWYVRRSRRRFWKSEDDGDKNDAYKTLHYVLVRLTYLLAPLTPFLAEELHNKLTGDTDSIHLKDWLPAGEINHEVMNEMELVRFAVNQLLRGRSKLGIKTRQPIASVEIKTAEKISDENRAIIAEEVNTKQVNVVFDDSLTGLSMEVQVDGEITPELKREGMMREVIRYIQNARKDAGLNVDDRIILNLTTDDDDLKTAIGEFSETIKSETLTEKFAPANQYEVSVKVEGRELNIRLAKS